MAKQIDIVLTDNPSNNDVFTIHINAPNYFYSSTNASMFKTMPTDFNHVLIGATVSDTIQNLYEQNVARYASRDFIEITKNADGITILVKDADATTSTIGSITGDIVITHTTVTIEAFDLNKIILSRSPFNIILQPTDLFDLATLNLKLYRGTQTIDAPTTDTFNLSRAVTQAGQSKISFEVSKLLNDYCKSNIPTFANGVSTSTPYDSIWVDAYITAQYLGENIGSASRQYLAVDGLGWWNEGYNPQVSRRVFTSIANHIVYRGSDYPLYFFTKDLVSITADGDNIPFTLDETINSQAIAYINLRDYYTYLNTFDIVFEYVSTTETHTITVKDECRFPVYNCFFKNKYGFWQSIPFNLRSKSTLNVESSDYMPIVSSFGEYSYQSHQKKTYLPTGKDNITCNTDYLPEVYNTLFDELMFSEYVYLENNGSYFPVNLNKKTFERKTKLFDKLIQYTMDFEYSFNKMNTVN